jgi:ferrous iron transport protein B
MSGMVVGLAGNPNSGKTTLFNALTGSRQRVGNWPGVTVAKKTGRLQSEAGSLELVDLPGIYSLTVPEGESAIDERIAQSFLLSGLPSGQLRLVVNIVDASNLERNLYLTAQLLEMRVPLVVALNMMDVAEDRRMRIDVDLLARRLGCPVVPIVASRGQGLEALKAELTRAIREPRIPPVEIAYAAEIEDAVREMAPALKETPDPRWLAIKLLEGDSEALRTAPVGARSALAALCTRLEEQSGEDPDILIAAGRYAFVHAIAAEVLKKRGEVTRTVSDRIDRVVLNRILGIPIFLAVMYALFMFTINIGGAFIDFFDLLFAAVFVDGFRAVLEGVGSPDWLTTLLADGVGGGIQTVATFIPIIGFLFLFLSVLEDSGYMARAAFVMDRFMRFVGLPGKSFVPLIVGFGCNVPAIMGTRTLDNQRDRTMTIMMTPFMSCGARLPVYALFAAAFFPVGGQNLVFALYLIGLGAAVLTGLALKNTLLKGETSPFIMELPPYHLPGVKSVLLRTSERIQAFVWRAGKVIVAVVVIISFLNSWSPDGTFGNEDTDQSALASIGRAMVPAFSPMGITDDNWPATVGIFTGILAKEAVVGTLDALYSGLAVSDAGGAAPADDAGFDLWAAINGAFATIPANLGDALAAFSDPLGLDIGEVSSAAAASEQQEVAVGTFGAMAARFDGAVGAFAYLLLVLLYMPCAAAIAAVARETTWKWTAFICGWTTLLGYSGSVLFYQTARFGRDPATATFWIVVTLMVIALVLATMRYLGNRHQLPRAVMVPGT